MTKQGRVFSTEEKLALLREAEEIGVTKTVFPDDQSFMKAVYLAINNIQQKWTIPIRSWGIIINQFIIKFGDR